MTGFPDTAALVAFTTPYSSASASWDDLSGRTLAFTCRRGRTDADEVCNPGESSVSFDNSDGELDPDNTTSAFHGYIRPNRRTRLQVDFAGNLYYLHSGYVDSWTRTWPGGAVFSGTQMDTTDRMKLLAKRTTAVSGLQPQEQAHVRMATLLDDADVPSISYSLNADAYNCRTLHSHTYDGGDALTNCQDVARSDGGAFFVDGQGKVIFQSTRYRTDNTRSTTSQALFGNSGGAGEIPVQDDLDSTVSDEIMTNRVLVTDYIGDEYVEEDTTAQGIDGVLELDLGSTSLRSLDAPDRAADVLLLRKDPRPRYDSITVDLLTLSAADQELVIGLEISDRITLAITPLGGGTAMSRDQYIEGVEHDVDFVDPKWLITFSVSGAYGGARVLP